MTASIVVPKAPAMPTPRRSGKNRIPSAAGKGSSFYAAGAQVDKPKAGGGKVAGLSYGQVTGTAPRTTAESTTTGTTIAAPLTPTVAPAPTPTASFNYANAFYSDPRYASGLAGITQSQLGIGSKYGLRLNRDTNPSSPTYGMVKYRVPGTTPGEGTITAKVNPQTGAMTYSDTAGKTYNASDLELDIAPIVRGEAGYLEGALGQAAAQSEKQQYAIGDVAARAGARRSGMRGEASAAETGALQSALRNLSLGAAGEFGGTTTRYADLLTQIYPDLVKQAEAMATPSPAPAALTTPTTPVQTPVATYNGAPTDTTTYAGYGLPKSGSALSQGPDGDFMRLINGIIRPTAAGGGTYGYDAQVKSLELMKRNYSLTPQQIRWIDDWIKNNKPKPKPAKGKGK